MKLLDQFLAWWKYLTRPGLRVHFVEMEPDAIAPGILYVVGTQQMQKWAIFVCPYGCKDRIELYLGTSRHPRWTMRIEEGRATLQPSVWQTGGCGAHFLVRRGRVDFV
jgi:hypothetical protein